MPEFTAIGTLASCGRCNRKILIEQVTNGSNHTVTVMANCWECLTPEEKMKVQERYKLQSE